MFNNFILFFKKLNDFLVHTYGGRKYALTWFLVLALSALPERRRDMVVGKVVAHLCLTLIIKELKFSVEHDRVVTTLNTIKH